MGERGGTRCGRQGQQRGEDGGCAPALKAERNTRIPFPNYGGVMGKAYGTRVRNAFERH